MDDADDHIRVKRTATPASGEPMKIIGDNMPAVLAHRLAHWSKDAAGMLTLTFVEERAQLSAPGVAALHVCARVVIPMSALEGTLEFLEKARSKHALMGTAPASSSIN